MFKRIPQPPIQVGLRSLENHSFWPGMILALIGVALTCYGTWRLTAIESMEESPISEIQLIKAYASGGLKFPDQVAAPPPPPPMMDNPGAMAEALSRWARDAARSESPSWKVRVDTTAKTPCPT